MNKERSALELHVTVPADEALRVPLSTQSRNVAFSNSHSAAFALEGKHGQVILFTIWFTVLFLKSVLAELTTALRAEKMIRMPRLVQCSDAFIKDWPVAVSAARREEVVVIGLTIRLTIAFKKVLSAQFMATVSANKVLRVPCPSQCCYHLPDDGLVASGATSFGGSGNALFIHISL